MTGEYRGKAKFKAIGSYEEFCAPGTRCFDLYDGNHSAAVFLANAYIDLGTWWCITPFVGAGVGMAYNRISGLSDQGIGTSSPDGGITLSPISALGYTSVDKSQWNMAWAVHAGLAYNVSNNFKIEFAYRYLNLGNVATTEVLCGGGGCGTGSGPRAFYTLHQLDSQELKIGLRWMLNAPEPVVRAADLLATPAADAARLKNAPPSTPCVRQRRGTPVPRRFICLLSERPGMQREALLRKLLAGLYVRTEELDALRVVHRTFPDHPGEQEVGDAPDLDRGQRRGRVGQRQLPRPQVRLLQPVAAPVAIGEAVERRHAGAGAAALDRGDQIVTAELGLAQVGAIGHLAVHFLAVAGPAVTGLAIALLREQACAVGDIGWVWRLRQDGAREQHCREGGAEACNARRQSKSGVSQGVSRHGWIGANIPACARPSPS